MTDTEMDWHDFDPDEMVFAGSEDLKNVSRVRLYKQVWSMPIKKVAALYDCESFHLRTACKKAEIPTPPGGHWAKLKAGKPVMKTPPLPPHSTGYDTVVLHCGFRERQARDAELRAKREEIEARLHVSAIPDRGPLHPVVAEVRQQRLQGQWGGSQPRIAECYRGPIRETEKRAFRAFSHILRVLSDLGFSFKVRDHGYVDVIRDDSHTSIRAREALTMVSVKREFLGRIQEGREFRRSERIIVEERYDRRWLETDQVTVEDLIPKIIRYVEAQNVESVARHKQRAEEEARREEQLRVQQVAREKLRLREEAWERYVSAARTHAEMRDLREFLETTLAATPDQQEKVLGRPLSEWFVELEAMIEDRDPLKDGGRGLVARIFNDWPVDQPDGQPR